MEIHAVTGAFGFLGKSIARLLLTQNISIKTLTNSTNIHHEFIGKILILPYHFDNPSEMVTELEGVSVLYNTYWVRFNYKTFSHAKAVENTLKLFKAAKIAGVKRIVHTSITNADRNSALEYFSSKGILEDALVNLGVSYAILRPALLFGPNDILINNIAWMLRRFPLFCVFGDGQYQLQPIFVEDFAELAVLQGASNKDVIIDAIGPETFSYMDLIQTISTSILDKKHKILPISEEICYWLSKIIGCVKGDVVLTREEIKGLTSNLLCTNSQPVGKTKLTKWLKVNKSTLGQTYASELKRRKNKRVNLWM